MRSINLILAVLWLIAAVVLAVVAVMITLEEGQRSPRVYYQLSVAAFILALYNLVRWWSIRAVQQQRPVGEPLVSRRNVRRPGDDVVVPDPNFNFTEPPIDTARAAIARAKEGAQPPEPPKSPEGTDSEQKS